MPLEQYPATLSLEVRELEALSRMGPDAFERWALRGWVETSPVIE